MLRTPRQAMTAVILLLALPACVTPFANKPAAPAPVVAMAAPEAPAIAQPEAPRPAPPEPALDAETRAIIETAIAALAPAEQAMPHRVTYYEFRGGGGRPCLRALLLALLLAQAN